MFLRRICKGGAYFVVSYLYPWTKEVYQNRVFNFKRRYLVLFLLRVDSHREERQLHSGRVASLVRMVNCLKYDRTM